MSSNLSSLPYTQDERTWAALAHATILLSIISAGLLSIAAAFVIWLIKKQESVYIGQQALQSLFFQVTALIVNTVVWIVIAVLSTILIGICLIPIGIAISLASLIWPLYAAYACSIGRDFRYPFLAEMVGIK
jgi:uncharacterized Tic20 family protein